MHEDFKVEIHGSEIKVTHAEGHEYTFHLPADGVVISSGHYREAQNAKHSAVFFMEDARKAAEESLRKARREGYPGNL